MPTTTTRQHADARSSVGPRLSCQTIIFMNGPPLTGKTTAAGRLGCKLGIPVLATHEHGGVTTSGALDSQKRLSRYSPMLAQAHTPLEAGTSVILDASFLDHKRRFPMYALAREFGARLIAVRTNCDDLALIRTRARQRAMDPNGKDRDVGVDAYLTTRDEVRANLLEGDSEFWELGVEVVDLCTGKSPTISCAAGARADARLIASILEESLLLASSRARAPRVSGRHVGAAT